MQNLTQLYFPDVPETDVVISPCQPGVFECRINVRRETKLRFLLLPERMISIGLEADPAMMDDLLVIMGRVIALHAGAAADREFLEAQFETLIEMGGTSEPPSWPDLPGVRATPVDVRGRLASCGLHSGRDMATLFLTIDTAIPMARVEFSDLSPERSLLVAVGRMIVEYSRAIRNSGRPS